MKELDQNIFQFKVSTDLMSLVKNSKSFTKSNVFLLLFSSMEISFIININLLERRWLE